MNIKKAKKTKDISPVAKSSVPVAHAVGRRKSSVARVWLRRGGSGAIMINGKNYKNYFDSEITRLDASRPLQVTPITLGYDVEALVEGGGKTGQAGAVKLAIARALVSIDDTMRSVLREHNLLTVDSRVKERKKYGQKAARRKFQFVKR